MQTQEIFFSRVVMLSKYFISLPRIQFSTLYPGKNEIGITRGASSRKNTNSSQTVKPGAGSISERNCVWERATVSPGIFAHPAHFPHPAIKIAIWPYPTHGEPVSHECCCGICRHNEGICDENNKKLLQAMIEELPSCQWIIIHVLHSYLRKKVRKLFCFLQQPSDIFNFLSCLAFLCGLRTITTTTHFLRTFSRTKWISNRAITPTHPR